MMPVTGNLFMVVAPSGAGKSSLVSALLKTDKSIRHSLSCTTRAPRPGEEDGRDYQFISVEQFLSLKEQGALLEWAEVHGNFYGTPRQQLEQYQADGFDIILEIDWQGARQIKEKFPSAIGIFILPPSIQTLESRLKSRGQDSTEVIARRLLAAGSEIAHAAEFEYAIINQDFNQALIELHAVVAAMRLRFKSQAQRYSELFSQLGIAYRDN